MSDVDVSVRVHGETTRMWLNGEFTEELSLRSEFLYALIAEFGRIYFIILSDRDAHTSVELSFTLAASPPFQQELRSSMVVIPGLDAYTTQQRQRSCPQCGENLSS